MSEPDSGPIETELKLVVDDRAALEAILSALGPERAPKIQDNLYFDDPDATWSRHGFALRMRTEGLRHRLTVKTQGTDVGEFVARGEWESELAPATAEGLRHGGADLLRAAVDLLAEHGARLPAALEGSAPLPVGSMHNVRRRAALPGFEDLEVELDETTYPNGDVRHEVELEVADAAAAGRALRALRAIFDRAGVAWRPSKVTKRERLERVLRGQSA